MGKTVDFLSLPPADGRVIYVEALASDEREHLEYSGYNVVDLFTLNRNTDSENVAYLRAKAQAIEEGTINSDQNMIRTLELEMRSYGMLDKFTRSLSVSLQGDSKSLDQLLSWGSDRHTLSGNSTVVSAQLELPQEDEPNE